MQVILRQRRKHLGNIGDVVDVKPGYARNFLIPEGIAIRATGENQAEFQAKRSELEAHNLQLREEAELKAKEVDGIDVVIIRAASETGHLYGSVKSQDVAKALQDKGFNFSRQMITITESVKNLGYYKASIALHPEVHATVGIYVAQSEEEAAVQQRK